MRRAARPLVYGVDPGSRWVGWAAFGERFVGGGVLDVASLGEGAVVRALRGMIGCSGAPVGVEVVDAVGYRPGFGTAMAGDIARTARLAGRIVQAMEDDGQRVVQVTAEAVRSHFFDRPSVDAAAVRVLVCRMVPGWPAKHAGVRAAQVGHVRDAGAAGLYVRHLLARRG